MSSSGTVATWSSPSSPRRRSARERLTSTLLPALVAIYFGIAVWLFIFWMNPSLTGANNNHIAADSGTYIYFAETLRNGTPDPWVLTSLATFPNTLWGPVLFSLVTGNTYVAMVTNLAIFALCLWLFSRSIDMDSALFLLLMAMNLTTTISLLSVNKEILDLLVLALFLYYLRHGNRYVLGVSLSISLISRYESFVVMLLFLFLRSRFNPFRLRRGASLVAVCLALNVAMTFVLASPLVADRLAEAERSTAGSNGTLLVLNSLEAHFLFVVAVVPKILDNLFAELLNVSHWSAFSMQEPANTFVLFFNNLANFIVLASVILRRRFTLRSSLIYYAAVLAIVMSVSVVVQARYFFGVYTLLCLELARHIPQQPVELLPRSVDAIA